MKIIDRINNGESLDLVLSQMIEEQRTSLVLDSHANYQDGSLEEQLDSIERNYAFNKEKLSFIQKIEQLGNRAKLLEVILYIDSLDISDSNKISTILTLGVLLNLYNMSEFYTNEEIYLLSTIFISIPIKDYYNYQGLLNSDVLDRINVKTDNFMEKRNIAYRIFDYLDECDNDSLDNIMSIVDVYSLEENKKRV